MAMNSFNLLLLIIACGLVTWIPRIAPFIFSKKMTFSKFWKRFMTYIPMCILTALLIQNLLIIEKGKLTTINIENLVVTLPTLVIAFLTKSLMWTVVFGIVAMTLVRYLGIF